MINIRYAFMFAAVLVGVKSFKPDCDPKNQFRHYCFIVEYCTAGKCDTNGCGYYFNSTLVNIIGAKIIPKCAFVDSPYLKQIIGRNQNTHVIASGSFVNLPNLEVIDLSINLINSIHYGTFKDVAVKSLDLSWNKIEYIHEGAFSDLSDLRYLNLSRNQLSILPTHQLPKKLADINLSYNLFNRFALSSNLAPSLSHLDLSHNQLQKLALQFDNNLKEINLNDNDLTGIDYSEVTYCEEVKIAANRFSTIPDLLKISSIKRAAISPNPWKCDELEKLWPILSMNSVNLVDDEATMESNGPICGDSTFANRFLSSSRNQVKFCEVDAECAEEEICRYNSCLNPCLQNICDSSRSCQVILHYLSCPCRDFWKQNPADPLAPCQNVECFNNLHCLQPGTYCQNNTCISLPGLPPNSYPTTRAPTRGYSGYAATVYNSVDIQTISGEPSNGETWWINDL